MRDERLEVQSRREVQPRREVRDERRESAVIAAIEPTSWIVIAVFLLTLFGVAVGLYTRKGSGINEHPGSDSIDPVVDAPDPDDEDETGPFSPEVEDTTLDQHGTK
jgi:hypothetical protein